MPFEGLPGHEQSESRAAEFPADLRYVSHDQRLVAGKFDHSKSGFPLTGMHTVPPRQCVDCHVNNNYNITNTTCVSCHLKDYQTASNPNHVQQNFPQTCEMCHTTNGWSPASFDHSKSGFPLTGAHTVPPRQCTDCHINNNYNITNTSCVSCHQNDYNNAKSPVDHVGAHFPTTCEQCHDTVNWMDGTFNHAATGWALTGSHTVPPRQCTDCHINGNYNITNTACVSCHQNDYNNAKSPVDHIAAKFPTTCELCHDTINWMDGTFDHSSTGWALTGSHTVPPRQCTDCHVNGNYNITNTACVSCHQNDYNNAKSPVDHIAAKFPTTCEMCHDTVLWTDGKFDHSQTGWALTGSHTVPPRLCTDCHVNGNYNITNTVCYSCHAATTTGQPTRITRRRTSRQPVRPVTTPPRGSTPSLTIPGGTSITAVRRVFARHATPIRMIIQFSPVRIAIPRARPTRIIRGLEDTFTTVSTATSVTRTVAVAEQEKDYRERAGRPGRRNAKLGSERST